MQGWPSILSGSIVMRSCTCALTEDHPNTRCQCAHCSRNHSRSISVCPGCRIPIGVSASTGASDASPRSLAHPDTACWLATWLWVAACFAGPSRPQPECKAGHRWGRVRRVGCDPTMAPDDPAGISGEGPVPPPTLLRPLLRHGVRSCSTSSRDRPVTTTEHAPAELGIIPIRICRSSPLWTRWA
jgi:hypothetical protein